jgi:hypothetical protein
MDRHLSLRMPKRCQWSLSQTHAASGAIFNRQRLVWWKSTL